MDVLSHALSQTAKIFSTHRQHQFVGRAEFVPAPRVAENFRDEVQIGEARFVYLLEFSWKNLQQFFEFLLMQATAAID